MNGNQALQYRLCPYESGGPEPGCNEQTLQRILGLLNKACEIDFRHYKRSSLVRRIERRMDRLGLASMEKYARLLPDEPEELLALGKDLLIGATHFFHDPQAFETIQKKVIPAIAEIRRHERHIRVWVAGCSTGEEAYSLAMLFHQFNETMAEPYSVKIFSTDPDKDAVDAARRGIYPEAAVTSLPKPWLRRYFIQNGEQYQIGKEIRKMVVFAHRNMIEDPPFSRLDLIVCRNLLINQPSEKQRKVLSAFHLALNPDGFMVLGPIETIGRLTHLFVPYDRKRNIFRQKAPGPGPVFASKIDGSDQDVARARAAAADSRGHLDEPARAADRFKSEPNANYPVIGMEQELRRQQESLRAAIEELKASNEELQAINEELVTANAEYQCKLQKRTEANDDMDHFWAGTEIGTVFLDTDMRIRRFTPAATKEFYLSDVDCGRPFGQISHNFDEDDILRDARQVLKTLIPVEREIRSRNGLWYQIRVLPYLTSEQVIKGIILTFLDITELKSVNERLLLLSYAIEQSPSITVIADADGRIQYVNPKFTETTGFHPTDVAGSPLRELNQWDNSPTLFEEIWSIVSSGHEWKGELKSWRKNGPNYPESVKFLPIKDRDGRIIHYLKIAEDITERKQTEELLRKSEMLSAVGQLAAGIAHEIRNPLTALKGFTKLMGSRGHHGSYLSIMSAELERIEEIVSELLVLAKPHAADFLPKSVASILNDVIMLLETQAILCKVTIETDIEDELPPVSCVENQLKQVFINVLKNGVEAMPGGGAFRVKAEKAERGIRISFIDQGCGIPETKLSKLGQPFYTTKNKGTGLGLMISYKIIENHRGSMTITSKEGVGTTVVIELPAVP